MATDRMEIEVPAPLAKFKGQAAIDADNQVLIDEWRSRYKKILTGADLKGMQRRLQKLNRHLAQHGIDALLTERGRLLDEINVYKQQYAEMRAEFHQETCTVERRREVRVAVDVIVENARLVRDDLRRVSAKIAPYRRLIQERDFVQQRISEHQAALADKTQADKDAVEMAQEANYFAEIIIRVWSRLKFRQEIHRVRMGRTQIIKRLPRFTRIIATPDEIQFKIDVSRLGLLDGTVDNLPDGVSSSDLVSESTLREITIAAERQVTSPNNEKECDWSQGTWLRLFRLSTPDGIMKNVYYRDVMDRYPVDRHHRFPIPLGVKSGRHVNWIYLTEHPHMMFNGQTGSGKTNAMRVVLTALIENHSPDEVRFILIDLKRGGDFNRYEDTPHCIGSVVKRVEDVARIMRQLEILMQQRMDVISQVTNDIVRYNQIVAEEHRLPRILVVFDEYTAIHSRERQLSHDIESAGIMIATQARAAGIQLLIGNQQPYSDAVHKQIKSNITLVLGGRQRTLGASMSTFGTGEATQLQKIPGRMLCDDGTNMFQVQIPYVTEDDINQSVVNSAKWHYRPFNLPGLDEPPNMVELPQIRRAFGIEDVLRIALTEYDGALKAQPLWEGLENPDISRSTVQRLVKQVIDMDDVEYQGRHFETVRQPGNFYRLIERGEMDTA